MLEKISGQEWFAGLLDFVFPPLCLGCGEYHDDKSQICAVCLGQIEAYNYPLCLNCQAFVSNGVECPVCRAESVILFAYANYQPPLNEIIHQFKFKGITSPAHTFANLTYEKFKDLLCEIKADALLPIPLHQLRENRRGYNQAELYADELSKFMGIPVNSDILIRTKQGKEQARLPFQQRISNIKNVFAADPTERSIKSVILVDDVVTSGATVLEAKRVLKNSGREVAGIISIAHGLF
jgi:ComF family protein